MVERSIAKETRIGVQGSGKYGEKVLSNLVFPGSLCPLIVSIDLELGARGMERGSIS